MGSIFQYFFDLRFPGLGIQDAFQFMDYGEEEDKHILTEGP